MHHSILFAALILIWSIKPFIKKFSGKHLTSFEFMIIQSVIYMSIILSVWLFNPSLVSFPKTEINKLEFVAILVLSITSVISSFCFNT